MDIDSFFTFFNGIYCDYDGAAGDQCFDLANNYSRWIGGGRFTGATADLIYGQTQNGFYQAITNTPDGVPQRGDIVVWNWPHVGIASGNNSNTASFEVLEQNDPEDSNCHIKQYPNYNGVIGWLRPVNLPQNGALQQQLNQALVDRDLNWNCFNKVMNAIPVTADPNNKDSSATEGVNAINELKNKPAQVITITKEIPVSTTIQVPVQNQTPVTTASSAITTEGTQNQSNSDGSSNINHNSQPPNNWLSNFFAWLLGTKRS